MALWENPLACSSCNPVAPVQTKGLFLVEFHPSSALYRAHPRGTWAPTWLGEPCCQVDDWRRAATQGQCYWHNLEGAWERASPTLLQDISPAGRPRVAPTGKSPPIFSQGGEATCQGLTHWGRSSAALHPAQPTGENIAQRSCDKESRNPLL